MLIRRKVFSVLEDETGEERLFSTSEVEYLGDEFYEVDDKMFAEGEEDSKAKKAAKYAGIGSAAALASVPVAKLAGVGLRKKAHKMSESLVEDYSPSAKWKLHDGMVKASRGLEKPYDYIKNSKVGKVAGKGAEYAKKAVEVPAEYVKGQWNKSGKLGKAGMVAVPVATLAAAAYGVGKKLHDKKKDN